MLIVDDKEIERKSDFLEDCSQFTPKQREACFVFLLHKAKCFANQENTGEGLKYWRGE